MATIFELSTDGVSCKFSSDGDAVISYLKYQKPDKYYYLSREISSSCCCCGECMEMQDLASGTPQHLIEVIEKFNY